ncbi:HMA2 domain-containing protein [Methyloceanibacter methanicus]|uniref:HMA2 domain-containing protein n=1 Tax=Methyloceanibacter methanicus TaxID=1774968 RepID=UPI00114D17FA|nr:heavy-metal-associated domain-containing protein [Methyloceanibacter methanicus]
MVYCIHHVPGRARFKVPRIKQDRAFAHELETKLLSLEGVHRVEVNPSAHSVIVHYDVVVNPLGDAVSHMHGGKPPIETSGCDPGVIPLSPKPGAGPADRKTHEEISRGVGKIVGQAVFATLVQRTLERSLLSLLTGLR